MRACCFCRASTAAAPLAASTASESPPSATEPEPETSRTSAGPSAPYRPASAHTATRAGAASSSGARVCAGTANVGRTDASAPGLGADVSGISATPMPWITSTPSSTRKTRCVGAGRNCTMSPEPSAPDAVPVTGATALAIVPLALFRSSIPAPIAPAAAPVDRPWMIRAISSCGTPSAVANTTMTTAWIAMAASSTGRRPTWSDSEPTVSSAASTARA